VRDKLTKYALKFSYVMVIACLVLPNAIADPQESSASEAERQFIARLISTTPELDAEFIAQLEESFMPVWQELKTDSIISSVSLFKVDHEEFAKLYSNDWLYLLLIELEEQATAEQLLAAEITANCYSRADSNVFQILRTELMKCTENSCYGYPCISYEDAPSGIDYLIEFIGTVDEPDSLVKYRELMSKFFGPVNGMLWSEGLLHCFNALETKEVLYEAPGVENWNQIHISDYWDESPSLNWDSVYVQLFWEEFSADLDSVWNELPPTTDGGNYRGHLIPKVYIR
jgi:hypothetical protein